MQFNSETFEDKYIGNIYSISGPPTSQSKGNKSKKKETIIGKVEKLLVAERSMNRGEGVNSQSATKIGIF